MIDVRAPLEFAKGALPSAVNLPFINNQERHLIGICYKEKGQQAAINLGHQLVNGDDKNSRVKSWQQFLLQHPHAVLYCARGGLRSELSQQWLAENDIQCSRVVGGYKALRGFLIQYLEDSCRTETFTILSGMTGTGKTDIIRKLNTGIDLEGHANHKGSSFGRPLNQQPTQINFENSLILALLKVREHYPGRRLTLEDENRNIGGRHLPGTLNTAMAVSDIIVIESSLEERIEKLWQEYVLQRYTETVAYYQDNAQVNAEQAFSDHLTDSLMRVQKRLGSQRTKEILALIKSAVKRQHIDNFRSHQDWLRAITVDYYDPMYLYQLDKCKERVVFIGKQQAIVEWLQERT